MSASGPIPLLLPNVHQLLLGASQFKATYHPLTEDVEGLRLLALADGVADLALDDGAVLAPVEAVQTQLRPVVPRHDGAGQEPPEK